jgi:3-oxoadipate enol-lactonase
VRGRLAAIQIPTFAVVGRGDTATPPANLEEIVAEIDGAKLVVIDDAAHLVNVERPESFNAALLGFLSS